ncbi:MAG TPA: NADH pyrophosphatase zinc ribbon domain-containing protein, partial [Sphingomicrobium sp.]|nr:NADH pyrophosphatase zinc ribbon domain-containing protein [Sphingomicrobium sp.]
MTRTLSEPFFSGQGLDRADALRADEPAIHSLATKPFARQLQWLDGLPRVDGAGRVVWQAPVKPELFLGLDGEIPCFSAIEEVAPDARSAFHVLALLADVDAPVVAAALSLSRWHSRHRFCANCGCLTNSVRGGWSRRCPTCGAEHFPRVDPVVIMIIER